MNIQTIQKTHKKYKLLILIGSIAALWGLISLMVDISARSPSTPDMIDSLLTMFVGVGIYSVGKSLSWWNHE